jgi:ABC-type Fe3+/spermidine/putrescine transport system ATPase subunit
MFAAELTGDNNRIEGTLIESAAQRAFIEVMGTRVGGLSRTAAAIGEKVTGVIRVERMQIGGGPGPNRLHMKVAAQIYLGERWELHFAREGLSVRAYVNAPLRHEFYHVEFPPDALWLF